MLPNEKVRDYFHLGQEDGAYGVEVEMELTDDPYIVSENRPRSLSNYWRCEGDGSLKVNGVEWVLRHPKDREGVVKALARLESHILERDLAWDDTVRAGVHIHLNVQEWFLRDVAKFMLVYYVVESVLVASCGMGRSGNNFCLRARDAEVSFDYLNMFMRNDPYIFRTDDVRYSAMNLKPMYSYGSIEFRAMQTPQDLSKILNTIDYLECIKSYSDNLVNPWDMAGKMSADGARALFQDIFREYADELWYEGAESDMFYDMRNAQMCFHTYSSQIGG